MNPLEVRTMVHHGLNAHAGTQYGQILTIEPIPPVSGDPAVRLLVTAPDPSGRPRVIEVGFKEKGRLDPVAAIKDIALHRAQELKDKLERAAKVALVSGKDPDRVKVVIEAAARFDGALTLLAHVLAAAGEDVFGYGDVPSVERAHVYLNEWVKKQETKA